MLTTTTKIVKRVDVEKISDEESFSKMIQELLNADPRITCLSIETGTNCPGFPDLLITKKDNCFCGRYLLAEVKVTDRRDQIRFQRAQLMFYKKFIENMSICFFVFQSKKKKVYVFKYGELIPSKAVTVR